MGEQRTDRELLRHFTEQGSEGAFQTLVHRHVDLVFATALRRLGNREFAQEVAQEVFISLARKAMWLRGEVSLAGWLHKTTLLQARQWWRGELRRRRREQTALELGTTMKNDPSKSDALAVVLDEGLMELREGDRQALMLRYFDDHNHREVGALLGIGEDAARKRSDKALRQLTAFFRRRGYAVPALATTEAALRAGAQTAPPGLAAVAAKSALSAAGGAVSAGTISVMLARLLGLTKVQRAAVCLLVAAAPVAYHWHALANARSEQAKLTAQLTGLRQEINSREQTVGALERKIRSTDASLAGLPPTRASATRIARGAGAVSPDLYLWDEQSDYVRLPKSLVPRLTFGEFKMEPRGMPRGSAPPERVQAPPLARDGTPAPALLDALGLTAGEAQQVSDATRQTFADFEALASRYGYFTNLDFSMLHNFKSQTRFIPPILEEGEQLRESYSNSLVRVIGEDRTRVFWEQAQKVFRDQLDEFGRVPKAFTVARLGNGKVAVGEMYFRPDGTSRLNRGGPARDMEVPGALEPYIEAWNQQKPPQAGSHEP
ncbi:MAG: RNA polymerase sigma factor [Acidobacteriota bacterium]